MARTVNPMKKSIATHAFKPFHDGVTIDDATAQGYWLNQVSDTELQVFVRDEANSPSRVFTIKVIENQ